MPIDEMTGEEYEPYDIACPRCKSTDWSCWDERQYDVWDKDGWQAGLIVVGYLRCSQCKHVYKDQSVDHEFLPGEWLDNHNDRDLLLPDSLHIPRKEN